MPFALTTFSAVVLHPEDCSCCKAARSMRGIRWACWKSSKATDEGSIWIQNSSSSSLISLIESAWIPMNEIEFLNCLFFAFWDWTKKPNELENIPLSTVITRVSIDSFTLTTSEIPELEFRLQRLRSLDYRQSLEVRYLDLMSDGSFVHVFFVVLSLMNEEALLQRGQMSVGKMAFWIQLLQIYLLLHTDYQQLGVIRHYDTLLSLFFKISHGISSYLTSSQKGFNSKWQLSFLEPN